MSTQTTDSYTLATGELEAKIVPVITALLRAQERGKHTVFFSYSGHVHNLTVTIYKGKWSKKRQPVTRHFDLDQNSQLCEFSVGIGFRMVAIADFINYLNNL